MNRKKFEELGSALIKEFIFEENRLYYICESGQFSIREGDPLYAHFLTRVIEGINREKGDIEIFTNPVCVWVRNKSLLDHQESWYFDDDHDEKYMPHEEHHKVATIDEAKKCAIYYYLKNKER